MISPIVAERFFEPPSTFNAHDFFGAAIVGYFQVLSYLAQIIVQSFPSTIQTSLRRSGAAFSFVSMTAQHLRAEIGRVSSITTRSPTLQALVSSCARYFLLRLKNFCTAGA